MGARDLLDGLHGSGFSVKAEGERLVVSPWSKMTGDLLAALRTAKPELLALLANRESTTSLSVNTCADCRHLLPYGTCAEPVAAGLIPIDAGFGIAWPSPTHASTCVSFSKVPVKAQGRPYRLTKAQGDAAHADEWDDASINRFTACKAAVQRRGFDEQDAEDLAELMHLLGVQAEDRVLCLGCRHLSGAFSAGRRCGNNRVAGVARELPAVLATQPQRCPGFDLAEGCWSLSKRLLKIADERNEK